MCYHSPITSCKPRRERRTLLRMKINTRMKIMTTTLQRERDTMIKCFFLAFQFGPRVTASITVARVYFDGCVLYWLPTPSPTWSDPRPGFFPFRWIHIWPSTQLIRTLAAGLARVCLFWFNLVASARSAIACFLTVHVRSFTIFLDSSASSIHCTYRSRRAAVTSCWYTLCCSTR